MADERSQVVGGALFDLWMVGSVFLPLVASLYYEAGTKISATGVYQARAFRRMSSGQSAALASWAGVRNGVQSAFHRTAENLLGAGEVLIRIADDFARLDTAAGEEMLRLIAERLENGDELVPPSRTVIPPPDPDSADDNRPQGGAY